MPESTLGLRTARLGRPDLFRWALRYQVNKDLELGVAYLYDDKESACDVNNATINGTFDESAAHLLTFGLSTSCRRGATAACQRIRDSGPVFFIPAGDCWRSG